MIGGTKVRKSSKWPLFVGLAIACAFAVALGWFLQQRALTSATAAAEGKVTAFVKQTVGPAVSGVDLSKPLGSSVRQRLDQKIDKGVLATGPIVRVRVFSINGQLLYSTDAADKLGSAAFGYPDALRGAAGGALTSLVDDDSVTVKGGVQSLRLLRTYAPMKGAKDRTIAVVAVDQRYAPLDQAAGSPWHTVQMGFAALAVLFLGLALYGVLRRSSVKRSASRSGFGTAKKRAANEPAETKRALEAAEKTAEREGQIREALEDQLEQLRAKLSEQDEATAAATRELTEQLAAATRRAEQAEAGGGPGPSANERDAAAAQVHEAVERLTQMEARALSAEAKLSKLEGQMHEMETAAAQAPPPQELPADLAAMVGELSEARRTATEQQRRALEQEQRALEASERANVAQHRAEDLARESEQMSARLAELEQAAVDATRTAAENAQRADATEALRGELEAKLAQVGARGQELETRAAELERRASEAETSGDVVRSELAELGAERDALRSRAAAVEMELADAARRLESATSRADESERRAQEAERRAAEALEASSRAGSEAQAMAIAAQGDTVAQLEAARAEISMSEAARVAAETRAEEAERRLQQFDADGQQVHAQLAQVQAELQQAQMIAQQAVAQAEAAAQAQIQPVGSPEAPPVGPDGSLVADLERELAESHAQLEQMEFRLQRAYADAEEARARAQIEASQPADDTSGSEMQQVRMDLAHAMDRAQAAEERVAKLEADLLAAQHGVRDLPDAELGTDDDGASENGDGDVDADGKSLRYRLARTAARKKLSGDLPTLS